MAVHGQLSYATLHLMWHLGCQGNLAVDVATQADGDELVWI